MFLNVWILVLSYRGGRKVGKKVDTWLGVTLMTIGKPHIWRIEKR